LSSQISEFSSEPRIYSYGKTEIRVHGIHGDVLVNNRVDNIMQYNVQVPRESMRV